MSIINDYNGCLEPIEMNFYLQGTLDVIDIELSNFHSNNPGENWEFVSIDLVGAEFMGNDPVDLVHLADITYAQRVARVPIGL